MVAFDEDQSGPQPAQLLDLGTMLRLFYLAHHEGFTR